MKCDLKLLMWTSSSSTNEMEYSINPLFPLPPPPPPPSSSSSSSYYYYYCCCCCCCRYYYYYYYYYIVIIIVIITITRSVSLTTTIPVCSISIVSRMQVAKNTQGKQKVDNKMNKGAMKINVYKGRERERARERERECVGSYSAVALVMSEV